MSKNAPDTTSKADRPGIEELKRHISKAREHVQAHLGRGDAADSDKLGMAASMLAQAEDLLERPSQPSSSDAMGLSSTSRTSTYTSISDSGSIPTAQTTQALSPLSSSAVSVNPTPASIATQPSLSARMSLNPYSEAAIPSNRIAFSGLWSLWAFENRKTRRDIPTIGGKFLDLHLLALNVNLMGGHTAIKRDPSLWKRLAVQLKLIDSEAQDDEHSRRVVGILQKTQEEMMLPFEQYCIKWSHISEEERDKVLTEYTKDAKSKMADLPPVPEVADSFTPTSTTLARGPTINAPNPSPELYEAIKLVDFYFHGFYPGVRLHTKIERLLNFPPSELRKHTWARKRMDFLSRFSQNHAGRTIDQIITSMAVVIRQQLRGKKRTPIPPSGWPVDNVKVTEVVPPTSSAMFSPSLIVQANRFVENTLQAVEDVRPFMKRIEVLDAHRPALKALVTEAYALALYFYRAAALHYMLFLNEKETRCNMMHCMFIIEQFFLSSTGYPAHIISLEAAVTSATSLRDVAESMRNAYAKRYQDHLRLKAEESRGVGAKP